MDNSCVFCLIDAGRIPSCRVHESPNVLAFLDVNPMEKGHVLVIPRRHWPTLADVPDERSGPDREVWNALCDAVRRLAKAAVRAGFDTLLEEAGVSYGELGRLYLAGGFGFALDLRKAAVIGLIPEELLPVTEAAGNSALAGAARFLRRAAADGRGVHAAEEEVGRVVSLSAEKALGGNAIFERRYLGNMEFRKSCDIL